MVMLLLSLYLFECNALVSLSKCNLSVLLFKCGVLVPNLILLECFVNNVYIYPFLVNFFYKKVDYLLGC